METFTVTLRDIIRNGTTDVITAGADEDDANDVDLRAYHAQLNEEHTIEPEALIDSVEEMTATQKTALRAAARIDFRERIEFLQVLHEAGRAQLQESELSGLDAGGTNVIVIVRASGVSGITRLALRLDGSIIGRDITTPADLVDINTGDDVDIEFTVSLPAHTYTVATELELIVEGGNVGDLELITATFGDLIGEGRTADEAADLVVTPRRVESAIHNMDSDAQEDVRDALNINFVNLPDTPSSADLTSADLGQVLQVGEDADSNRILEFGEGAGDTSSLSLAELAWERTGTVLEDNVVVTLREVATAESDQHEVLRLERMVDSDGNVTWDIVASGNVRAG